MIAFPCPACGQGVGANDDLAGGKVRCPHCGRLVSVPTRPRAGLAPSSGASVAEPATLPPPPEAAAQETRSSLPPDGAGCPTVGHPAGSHDPELLDFLAPAQGPGELGRLGPYRVLKLLGAGGMGVVFRALDPQLERPVALKAMLPALAASAAAKQRFLREARAAAAIKHDHVVTIYQVGEDRGVPFLAMELLEGEVLAERLRRQRRLPVAEVLRLGREVAEGLAAAHECGLIHRDIKPANVWLEGGRARAKILDFGLARAVSDNAQLTQQGAIVGTPAFMAPEQANGQTVDARCDLFSLGCVLYRMATGRLPFRAGDPIATLMAVATEQPRPPGELNPALPAALSGLILQLLAKAPDERPPSARAVVEALEAIERRQQAPADVLPAPGPDAPPGPPRRPGTVAPPVAGAPAPRKTGRRSGARALLGCGGAIVLTLLLLCGGLAAGIYWVVREGAPRLTDQVKQVLEEQRGWDEVARFWRPPPADAGPDRLFPARVEDYTLAAHDTRTAIPELNLEAPGHHAVYRSPRGTMEVGAYRATRLEKEALFRRALDRISPPEEHDASGAPPHRSGSPEYLYRTVSGSADSPRIVYHVGPPDQRGILWWDRDWLFVVRTKGPGRPEEFIKKYLAALSHPEPEK